MFGALKNKGLKKDIRLRVSFFLLISACVFGGGASSKQIPINSDGKDLTRNLLPAVFYCPFHRELDSAAAGNFHTGYRYGADVIFTQDLRQLLGVIRAV